MSLLHKNDFKVLLSLAIPLIASNLVESATPFISVIFLAHLGDTALGAGSLTAWFFSTLMVILWGILTAVSVLVARYDGANDTRSVSLVLRDAMLLSLLLAGPVMYVIWHAAIILKWFGQKPYLVAHAVPYLHALAWGIVPDFIGLCLIQMVIGLGQARTNLVFTLLWVSTNITLNFIFVFGKLGIPAQGLAGLGWGTSLAYWLTTLGLIFYIAIKKIYRPYLPSLFTLSVPRYLWELLSVGLPMGMMYSLEIGFFFALSLIMGHRGIIPLAASQLTVQFMNFFITIVFAIAQAVTIRVGNQIGAKQFNVANRATYTGIIISSSIMTLIAMIEWFSPHTLLVIDYFSHPIHNPTIVTLAIQFMAIAAVFQLFESVRIILFGALRAHKDTAFALGASLIAFWLTAIPLGITFDYVLKLGVYGYWWGMVASGLINIGLLYWRYLVKTRRMLTM